MRKPIGRGRRRTTEVHGAARRVRRPALQRPVRSLANETHTLTTPTALLADLPRLARVVPHLPPETLHQLMRHCGLEACGQVIALATPAQLASVLDLDLWTSAQPGREELFDADRFGEWLELLADEGGATAARIVAAMDEDLVTVGLSRYIRVFDPAAIAMPASTDGAPSDIDTTPHNGFEYELGGYLVRAIRTDAWDAIVTLLLALEAGFFDRFHAVMRACRLLSNSRPETDGLDELLTQPGQRLHDAALDREARRSRQGYSTTADAGAFLSMARRRRRLSSGKPYVNPIAAAYFRAASEMIPAAGNTARGASVPSVLLPGDHDHVTDVVDVLAAAGLAPRRPRALLEGTSSRPAGPARIRACMEYLRQIDEMMYAARSHELAFLVNTLVAGCPIQSRSFTPEEALDGAVAVCSLGLEHWPGLDGASVTDRDTSVPDSFLIDHDLVSAFEAGWAALHESVSMFVADQLLRALSDLKCRDADIQNGLDRLRFELMRQRDAGTPWLARKALDVIAMLDMPAWVSLRGLLDECPTLPVALTATLEGRTGAIDASEFEFISTRGQFGTVREYMGRFPDLLSR